MLYVDAATGVDGGLCTPSEPCASFNGALDSDGGAGDAIIVLIGDGTEEYVETLYLYDRSVTIIGDGARLSPDTDNKPVIDVQGGSYLYITQLEIAGGFGNNSADGIACTTQSTVEVQQVTISGNEGRGLDIIDCALVVERSYLFQNADGGIFVQDSSYVIVNNFIIENGSDTSEYGGVTIGNLGDFSSPRFFEFNTLVANTASPASSTSGLLCTSVPAFSGFGNIIYNGGGGLPNSFLTNCIMHYSNIEGRPGSGEGSIDVQPLFVDPTFHDYQSGRIQPGSRRH